MAQMLPLFLLISSLCRILSHRFEPQSYLDGTPASIASAEIGQDIFSVVSFRFSKEATISTWVKRVISMHQNLNRMEIPLDVNQTCSVELMAVVPASVDGFGQLSLRYSEQHAPLSCFYATQLVAWEKKHRDDKPPHPAFVWCPAPVAPTEFCSDVYKQGITAVVKLDDALHSKGVRDGWFTATAPARRMAGRSPGGVGVCTSAVHASPISGFLIHEYIDYHTKLGLEGVALLDGGGRHRSFLHAKLPKNAVYFNYTMWSLLGRHVDEASGHLFIRAGDQDKSLSLTFCRFELHQLMRSILIVDFDEYIFCPGAALTWTDQGQALQRAVKNSIKHGAETMIWPRSALYNVSDRALEACLQGQHGEDGSVFKCFASWDTRTVQRAPRTQKALHHDLPCPFTDNHVSCNSAQYRDNGCECKSMWQNQCQLAHLNPEKTGHGWELKGHHEPNQTLKQNELLVIDQGGVHPEQARATSLSPAPRDLVPLPGVNIFYIVTPPEAPQHELRSSLVRKDLALDPERKVFSALYWADWSSVKGLYACLRMPTKRMPEVKGTHNRRGKYAEWGSKFLAVAYAVQFKLPYMVILEDDVHWSPDMRRRLATAIPRAEKLDAEARLAMAQGETDPVKLRGGLLKLSKWGEGYFLSELAARSFLRALYSIGINHHSDTWIRDYLKPEHHDIAYTLAVKPNGGNIYRSHNVNNVWDFPYTPENITNTGAMAPTLLRLADAGQLFKDAQERDLGAMARRYTSNGTSCAES